MHWPEYGIEAVLLGTFMVSACTFTTLINHPAGPVHSRLASAMARRALIGVAMGLTAITLIYSPWGQRSGAHMNPSTTLTFWLLGKVAAHDALSYAIAQFIGAAAGVALARLALGKWLQHASVNHVVTTPGPRGPIAAWAAEALIACGMMSMVLFCSNHLELAPFTGLIAGLLVAVYITVEAPLSGMSMNPARTFGSAMVARRWNAYWVYVTAPLCGMLTAAALYTSLPGTNVYCAKLQHPHSESCIFRCERDRLVSAMSANPATLRSETTR